MASPFVVPGDIVAEKYDVLRVLGVGGMGIVVAARHIELGHEVAIKFLRPEMMNNREAVARFLREGRAAVALQSDHVARVLDVGEMPAGDGTAPFMVLEMLAGNDLAEVLRRGGPIPAAVAVGYVIQACDALREAHALGIIHRDIKPANLFLAKRGRGEVVKVLDFGIAKDGRPDHSLTSTSALIGSPLYMSPEQHASARTVDARTDIWALGATLYELVLGIPPFDAQSLAVLTAKIMGDPVESLRSRRPEVPAGLDVVVLRCLEKDPAARFQTIDELIAALEPFVAAEPEATGPPPPEAPAVAVPLLEAPPPAALPEPAPSHARGSAIVIALGLTAVIGTGLAWALWPRPPREPSAGLIVYSVEAPLPPATPPQMPDASLTLAPLVASSSASAATSPLSPSTASIARRVAPPAASSAQPTVDAATPATGTFKPGLIP